MIVFISHSKTARELVREQEIETNKELLLMRLNTEWRNIIFYFSMATKRTLTKEA